MTRSLYCLPLLKTCLTKPVLLNKRVMSTTTTTHNHLDDNCIFCKIIK